MESSKPILRGKTSLALKTGAVLRQAMADWRGEFSSCALLLKATPHVIHDCLGTSAQPRISEFHLFLHSLLTQALEKVPLIRFSINLKRLMRIPAFRQPLCS